MSKWIFAPLLATTLLVANEGADAERIVGPMRPTPESEWLEHQQRRAERAESLKSAAGIAKGATLVTSTHKGALHNPRWISPLGDIIELEDGSRWSVLFSDRPKTYLADWLQNDLVVLQPNSGWFSSYHYRITNVRLKLTVEVNLSEPPPYNGAYTYWITAIDVYNNQVCLNDNTVWNFSVFDYPVYRKWQVNDTVIMGHNNPTYFQSRPNILINCFTKTYVEARCIN